MQEVKLAKAANGFDAGLRITELKPDVILPDYVMPGFPLHNTALEFLSIVYAA